MQYNYLGSVAQRNVKFTSGITVTEDDTSVEIFDSLMVFVPSFLAAANIVGYDGTSLTPTGVILKTVTADNYADVLTGELLSQWAPVFNDGANTAVTLYVAVFYCTLNDFGTYLTVGTKAIDFSPLTAAFNKVYSAAYFKFMFSEHYDGSVSTTTGSEYDDSHYFDLALCLSYLVENETTMSATIPFVKVSLADSAVNACSIMSYTAAQEKAAMTALDVTIAGVTSPRSVYFWGAMCLISGKREYICIHSESVYYIPYVFKLYFSAVNAQGVYCANKLDYIRLSGDSIKPTGLPNALNSDANDNLTQAQYTILDGKNVGYLMSIADGTLNNSILSHMDSVIDACPVLAPMVGKYIDYHCSQAVAKWLTSTSTLTSPVLKSENAYSEIKAILTSQLAVFASLGRLTSVQLNFPVYSSQTGKDSFTVTQGWSAEYVDDLHKVTISGTISA
jgi:hypothetical protein